MANTIISNYYYGIKMAQCGFFFQFYFLILYNYYLFLYYFLYGGTSIIPRIHRTNHIGSDDEKTKSIQFQQLKF